jgi:hypothetical protein
VGLEIAGEAEPTSEAAFPVHGEFCFVRGGAQEGAFQLVDAPVNARGQLLPNSFAGLGIPSIKVYVAKHSHGVVRRQALSSLESSARSRGKRERPDHPNQAPSPTAGPSAPTGDSTAAIERMPHREAPPGGLQPETGSASHEERGHSSEE